MKYDESAARRWRVNTGRASYKCTGRSADSVSQNTHSTGQRRVDEYYEAIKSIRARYIAIVMIGRIKFEW